MATVKLPTGVLYLEANKFDIYLPHKKTIISCPITNEAIKDFEIIDHEKLHNQIKTFLDTNKINPSTLIIVLGKNLLFEKDFPKKTEEAETELRTKTQSFIDVVPFEDVGSITLPLSKSFKVIAANADLYKAIMAIFRQYNFNISVVLPVSLYGESVKTLSADSLRIILGKTDSLKKFSLAKDSVSTMEIKAEGVKKKNYTMTILAGIMFIVPGILIIYALFFLK